MIIKKPRIILLSLVMKRVLRALVTTRVQALHKQLKQAMPTKFAAAQLLGKHQAEFQFVRPPLLQVIILELEGHQHYSFESSVGGW